MSLAGESAGLRGETVYLVEPQPETIVDLDRLLTRSHLRTEIFRSAEQFLSALSHHGRGVVVASTELPGMDGLALLGRLHQRGDRLPVILLANDGDVSLAVRALRAGAYDFLQKPVAPRLLLRRIELALADRSFLSTR